MRLAFVSVVSVEESHCVWGPGITGGSRIVSLRIFRLARFEASEGWPWRL